jgi:hypothetical protein
VYVAGNYTKADGVPHAGFWHNMSWHSLEPSGATMSLIGNGMDGGGIAVSGGGVYMTGRYRDAAGTEHSGYWFNGAWNELTLPAGAAGVSVSGIAVSGSNVYVAATRFESDTVFHAGYWLNGTWHDLSDGGYVNSSAFCIAASGSDFVIGGYCRDAGNHDTPSYWLNGNRSGITLGNTDQGDPISGSINDIALNGSTVHAVGAVSYFGGLIPYWVDGIEQSIGNSGNSIRCIAISSSTIYVVGEYGEDYRRGFLRIGSTWTAIDEPHDPTLIEDMAVSGNTIYFVGNYVYNFRKIAYRWTGGTYAELPSPASGANYWAVAIAVLTE